MAVRVHPHDRDHGPGPRHLPVIAVALGAVPVLGTPLSAAPVDAQEDDGARVTDLEFRVVDLEYRSAALDGSSTTEETPERTAVSPVGRRAVRVRHC